MNILLLKNLINNIKITKVKDNNYIGRLYELNISIKCFILLLLKNKLFVKYLQKLIITESIIDNHLFTVRIVFNMFSKNNINNTNVKFIIFKDSHIHQITKNSDWSQFNNQSKINRPHAFRSNKNIDTILIVPPFSNDNFANISKFANNASYDIFYKYFKFIAKIMLYNLDLIKNNPNPSKVNIKRKPYFWLSFHGGSVPWLHARLDSEPKYFPNLFVYLLY
jgi:hypothetical protein